MEINNLSVVTGSNCNTCTNTDKATMANTLFMANSHEICFAPSRIKGRFTKTIKYDKSMLYILLRSKETPIAPPSKK